MKTKQERALETIKRTIREEASELDITSAAELMSSVADWAYTQYEGLLIDDEPEDIECD